MTLQDAVAFALTSLRGNPIKSLLTVLGLAVGVGAVLTVFALGDAGEMRVEQEIDRLGVDKVWIVAESQEQPLTAQCSDALSALDASTCLGASTADAVALGDTMLLAQVSGYDAGLNAVHHPQVVEGRGFTEYDMDGACVCLLDTTLAERLHASSGDWVDCGMRRYWVAGIVTGMPIQTAMSGTGTLILPLQTWQDAYSALPLTELSIAVPDGEKATTLAEQALACLAGQQGSYSAVSLENEIDAARSVVRIFVMVLSCVAFVCVLTGGIGVMNVLLISVRERRREIGLIKAVGGTSEQVAQLFLLEAVAYALLGGSLGCLLGVGMTALFGRMIGLDAVVHGTQMVLLLFAAAGLGILCGVLPAGKAAALPPATALRTE